MRLGKTHIALLTGVAGLLLAAAALTSAGDPPDAGGASLRIVLQDERAAAEPVESTIRIALAPVGLAPEASSSGSASKPGNGSKGHAKPDPVATNGPIFLDGPEKPWPKPVAALVFTGESEGFLEPCGCAGLENQLGGLKRRHTMMKQLIKRGWPLVALDAGGEVRRFGAQAAIKYRRMLQSLVEIGYQGVGLGAKDLRLDLAGIIIDVEEDKNPITCANVGFWGFDELFSRRYRVAEAGGVRIGFTAVLADDEAARLGRNDDITILPAAEALREIAPKLAAENCDQQVLMVYGDADSAIALAKQFPQFHWVVPGRGSDVPLLEPKAIEGTNARLVEVGHKGQYAVVIGLFKKGAGRRLPDEAVRYQKVPLDHRFEDSPEMHAMMVAYQKELETIGLAGAGAKPLPHPLAKQMGGFAGTAACMDCHEDECGIWDRTHHSHATRTIAELDPPRHFDPECLSCHATGWEPQQYYPFTSGYAGLAKTPHLNANGCENCHGPGARHVAYMNGDLELSDEQGDALTAALRMKIVENEGNQEGQVFGEVVKNCMRCHDLDNSPDFDFQKYWPEVEHGYGE